MAMFQQQLVVTDTGPDEFVGGFVRRLNVPKGSILEQPDQRSIILRRKRLGPFFVGLFFAVIAPVVGWLFGWWIVSRHSQWRFLLAAADHPDGCLLEFQIYVPDDQTAIDRLLACGTAIQQMWLGVELVTRQPPALDDT